VSETATKTGGWLQRLKSGLSRSSGKIGDGITGIFTKRKLDDGALEELEELLITADLGVATAAKLTANLARGRFQKDVTPEEVRRALADDIAGLLAPVARPLEFDPAKKPNVVLVVGVNGSGKTTTIGKLASLYRGQGLRVMIAAGDTFRAAAIEQLQIWGERAGCPVVAKAPGADAAGLAYEALERARSEASDLLLIDTAGRLHNKADLMAELTKILRVLRKLDPSAPHACLLVLDATIGQNAHAQVETSAWWSPSWTARPGAACWWLSPSASACRCTPSGSANRPRTCAPSPHPTSPAPSWAWTAKGNKWGHSYLIYLNYLILLCFKYECPHYSKSSSGDSQNFVEPAHFSVSDGSSPNIWR
jgi:fused signal recognition particle receptor